MVRRRWRLAFMEDDGVGLMRAANNDGGLGEWDGTALEEWRSFWRKPTEVWEAIREVRVSSKENRQFWMGVRGRR
jgi:hypothetical protein